jgi:hypothetical protein
VDFMLLNATRPEQRKLRGKPNVYAK